MRHSTDTTTTKENKDRAGRLPKNFGTSESTFFKRIDEDFPKTIAQQNAEEKQYCRKVVVDAFGLCRVRSIDRDARQIGHHRKQQHHQNQIFYSSHL